MIVALLLMWQANCATSAQIYEACIDASLIWPGQGATAGAAVNGSADAAATPVPPQPDTLDQIATQPATQTQVHGCSTAPLLCGCNLQPLILRPWCPPELNPHLPNGSMPPDVAVADPACV
jgi:hypothetical protein